MRKSNLEEKKHVSDDTQDIATSMGDQGKDLVFEGER